MNYLHLLIQALVLLTTFPALAGFPDLRLPFEPGAPWQLTRGYGVGYHKDSGHWFDDTYAVDFALPGCDSWQRPILAAADGVVEYNGDYGYGINILINHGDGYKTRYAHMSVQSVEIGDTVVRGQQIGLAGNSGNVTGRTCPEHPGTHLHFVLYRNGRGIPPVPISGYHELTPTHYYHSDNSTSPGFTYNREQNPYICRDHPQVVEGTYWYFSCPPREQFSLGEVTFGLLRLDRVVVDFQFEARYYLYGEFVTSIIWPEDGLYSLEGEFWETAFNWPEFTPGEAGEWEIRFSVRTHLGIFPAGNVTFTVGALQECQRPPLWSWDYCTEVCPCGSGMGDCDYDAECLPGLTCHKDIGAAYGQDPYMDVCQ